MAETPGEGVGKKKIVKRTRKKKHYVDCDKTCGICRSPCDNPFHPGLVKPAHNKNIS